MIITHIVSHFLADAELSNAVKSLPGSGSANFTDNTLQTVFNLVMATLASVALFIVILAGFKYITSSGDPQGVATARKAIIYALVGLAICAASWSIVTLVVRGI